ncbi:Ethanolamine ammonia lyase large subunit [Methylobacterium oryzae CBMB20]|uniref:Ethanolamine ammonia lyase large subunit n=1 Tax=Methylobacterium oryzae CBMB20 TaxID=693986 RepID=A0A089P380_9HYPH|nr:Ethanolamine ammonia lyase large subunit [Methylobacterium oryzae CBMB20]
MAYATTIEGTRFTFPDLRRLLAKATPERSGDQLAGLCADGPVERLAAQIALADLPLKTFLAEELIPSEEDEVSDLIARRHDAAAFAPVSCLTVGAFREWLLSPAADAQALAALAPGLTPEMVAAVSKICRLQDLVAVAAKRPVVTRFRSTIGLPGRLATRNQPNHPTDSSEGILISALDGLLMGSGDAVIGVNPATDSLPDYIRIVELLETLRLRLDVPIQHCCLGHVTVAIEAMAKGAPVDLVFQSVAGSQKANAGFGVDLAVLREASEAARALGRCPAGGQVMYFETGQGSALSADAHWGVDQQTMEARAYAVAREFDPLLVNTVVGLHRPRIPVQRQADHPGRAGGPLLRQAARPADGRGRLLHQPCRCRRRGHGRAPDPAVRSRRQLRHHRAGGGRRDAELPVAVPPRRGLRPRDPGPSAGPGIRGVAPGRAHHGRAGPAHQRHG